MKKGLNLLVTFLFLLTLRAQTPPSKFSYQAAVRNGSGQIVASSAVSFRFTLRTGSAGGTIVYSETQTLNTSSQGIAVAVIGNGTLVTGSYPSASDWGANDMFLQVDVDPAGGTNYTSIGTTQLLSVPYSNYASMSKSAVSANTATTATSSNTASKADTVTGNIHPNQILGNGASIGQVLKWDGNNWIPDVDASGGAGGGDNWGTQTVIASAPLTGGGTSGNPLKLGQQSATTGQVLAWDGTKWAPANSSSYIIGKGLTKSLDTLNSTWTISGANIYNNNSGNVGIGNNNPSFPLDVSGHTKIGGYLGVGNTSPDPNYVLKSLGGGARDILLETTGSTSSTSLNLKTNGSSTDFFVLRKYGASASGSIADGTAFANTSSALAGTGGGKMLLGTLGNSNVNFITAGRTRLTIDNNGNFYTGNGTSTGAKLHATAGSNFFTTRSGDTLMAAIYAEADTTYSTGGYTAGLYSYGGRTGKNGIGAYFEGGRNSSVANAANYGMVNIAIKELTGSNTTNYGSFNQAAGGAGSFGTYNYSYCSRGSVTAYGMYAEANGFSQSSSSAYGLYARGTGATTNNYAAYFSGAVYVNGSLGKASGTFMIDHPQDPANKYLIHSFVESPEMMNVYNGNITTDASGLATVQLPSYFEVENINFKYQLTVIGQFAQAIVKEKISGNKFIIQTDKPSVEVSWQVTGVRNDKYAQAHPIEVEKLKEEGNRGKYLQPELYGLPEYMGIHYQPFKPSFGNNKK